ncbi:cytochrome b [Thiomicrorhabdus sp. ZW0627]|uniref:cytochrome b n=1 Tax=Thiomicrorhabdus sp. ZW0627 TaxID=3039774 RepID=UPI00243734DE|nr:cytochrome b [Thiomicrorhabdus sp. ZW0627]MDG6773432.1 cytochrome b [Thiomicrorhabdus sp. ZW0627]
MELKNGINHYGLVSRANHWISAFLFIGLIALGLYMSDLPRGPEKKDLYDLHKSLGIGLLALMLLRLVWLKISPNPSQISYSKFEHILGHATKGILYLAMLMMPISGWIMSNSGGHDVAFFDLFVLPTLVGENETLHEIAEEAHELGGYAMIAVILLHTAGALKHHFVYKDETLKRMLGKK